MIVMYVTFSYEIDINQITLDICGQKGVFMIQR